MKNFLKALFLLIGLLAGSASFAAIDVLSGASAGNTSGTRLTLVPPADSVSGDVLIAQVMTQAGVVITAPAGWTEVSTAAAVRINVQQRIYYLSLSATVAASYSWTLGSSAASLGIIHRLRGAAVPDCGSANTAICGASSRAESGLQITAPNVQRQPPNYPAGSLRMALFGTFSGSGVITPTLENGAVATPAATLGSRPSMFGLAGSYYTLASASDGGSQTASMQWVCVGFTCYTSDSVAASFIIAERPLTCFPDSSKPEDFNRTDLGSDWVATRVSGSFTPAIFSNRLRLTQNVVKQSTAVSLQRLFPGAGNYLQLSFKYYGYGGNGADGIAVILSDSAYTPQPGGFGGSLGYAPKSSEKLPGFAGGWLGIGLDEFGNFSNSSDSGACLPGTARCATAQVRQSVSLRGSAPYYYWLTGSGGLNPSVSNTTNSTHLYRVTIDARTSGRAMVSVERDTGGSGNAYTSLFAPINVLSLAGQSSLPANLILSFTGSTGDATNTHEIDDLKVCAQTMNPMTEQIDHFRIAVSSSALTCTPASVQVRACMDAACSKTYSGDVRATLTPSGWVGGDTQTFPGSGGTLKLSKTTQGKYVLGVSGSTPTAKAYGTTLCSIDGGAYSADCSLSFADAGLLYSVPAQTSGLDSDYITITAAKTDDRTKACVPAFSGDRAVKFWSSYVSPASGTMALSVNGTPLASSTASATASGSNSSTGTSVDLSFDAAAQAKLRLNYPDAGQISFNARYDGSVATGDAGLVMMGSSTFAVKPFALCVDATDSGWAACSASGAALQDPASCAKFRMAGENFGLRVTGKAFSASQTASCKLSTTPNYQQSGIVLETAVVAPDGGDAGKLSAGTISISSGGTATVSTSQSEVGMFTITARPVDKDYFGLTVDPGKNTFGRFVPAGFSVSGSLGNRSDLSCNASTTTYSYLGETLSAAPTITAVNLLGAKTLNYTGAFARLSLTPVSALGNGIAFGVQSGTALLNARLAARCTSCSGFSNGVGSPVYALVVSRAAAPDGPFNPASFGVAMTDPDGVTVLSPDYNWDLSGASEGKSLGTTRLYYGRMRVENAYGSSLLALPVPAYAQIWNGTSFARFTEDSCTTLSVPDTVAMSSTTSAALACSGGVGLYDNLGGVVATLAGKAAGSSATLAQGDAKLVLSKPGSGSNGYLDLFLNVPDYLKYDWDSLQSCSGVVGDNPRARIRFGARSNSAVIYRREVY